MKRANANGELSTAEAADREAIRTVLATYFHALDGRDHTSVLGLFAANAQLAMFGQHVASGRDEIDQYFTSGQGVSRLGVDRGAIVSMFHQMGTHVVTWRGDSASAETYAVAHVCVRRSDEVVISMRGIRYLDELVKTASGWLIVDRIHAPDWSVEIPGGQAVPAGERVARAVSL